MKRQIPPVIKFTLQICSTLMLMYGISVLLLTTDSPADDGWLCTETSSQVRGNSIYACGIGQSKDEAIARGEAYDESYKEFARISGKRPITIQPQRTSCNRMAEGFKCYRLIVYTVADEEPIDISLPEKELPPPPPDDDDSLPSPPVTGEVHLGMSVKDLFYVFGQPISYEEVPLSVHHHYQAYYRGDICVFPSQGCWITIESGLVKSINGIKPDYVKNLDM